MDAANRILLFLFLIPLFSFGQKSIYPKDTIYIKFEKEKHIKKKLNHPKIGKNLYFKGIGVYYNYKKKN